MDSNGQTRTTKTHQSKRRESEKEFDTEMGGAEVREGRRSDERITPTTNRAVLHSIGCGWKQRTRTEKRERNAEGDALEGRYMRRSSQYEHFKDNFNQAVYAYEAQI